MEFDYSQQQTKNNDEMLSYPWDEDEPHEDLKIWLRGDRDKKDYAEILKNRKIENIYGLSGQIEFDIVNALNANNNNK
jgi:hypothetical protein